MSAKLPGHADAVLNLGRGISAPGFTPFIGLFSVAPSAGNPAGVELSGGGYARQPGAFTAPADDPTDSGFRRQISNEALVSFGPAAANWPAIVAHGIFDAVSGGACRLTSPLPAPKIVEQHDRAEFRPGDLIHREA